MQKDAFLGPFYLFFNAISSLFLSPRLEFIRQKKAKEAFLPIF